VSSADPAIHEIENYLKLDVSCEDVLEFCRSSSNTFRHLRSLARIVLAILATSTPSSGGSRIFFDRGRFRRDWGRMGAILVRKRVLKSIRGSIDLFFGPFCWEKSKKVFELGAIAPPKFATDSK